ncbi:MAG: cardiolipin synthase [Phycisphaerales bacterium]
MWQYTISGILVVDLLARLALIAHIVMSRRSVPASLSWILLLIAAPPLVGIGLYALVGENRLGERRAARYLALTRHIEEGAVGIWRARHQEWTAEDRSQQHLAALGTRVSGMPPLRGNTLEFMGRTDAFLKRIASDIDASRLHCHLLYYIWSTDELAREVGEALIRAAGRGVICRVLVDGVGSRPFLRSELAERMIAAGVKVVEALPVRTWRLLLARVDLRNHRKIAVIDGEVAYTGSHNLTGARYSASLFRTSSEWVDLTVRLRGPAVQALQTVFLRDWCLDSDEEMPELESYLVPRPDNSGAGCVVHVIPSGPGPEPEAIHHALLATLHGATEEIIMTTPYFVPDEATRAALEIAAQRGVAVTLVLPEGSDGPLVASASRAHYESLLRAGVRIMHYGPGFLHSKTITIDRRVGVITSVNFDMRSFFLNFECSLFIYDDDVASHLRFLQMSYVESSREIELDAWRRRPLLRRIEQSVARLFSPLL